MRLRVLFAVLLMVPGVAWADEDCTELDGPQTEVNACFDTAYQAADKELNAVYKLVTHRLEASPDAAKLMKAAQRSWVGFRDAECAFVASAVEGGSAQPAVESQCLADMTRKRTADLTGYLNCEEGDMACPVPKPE